jgi:hypothetical protein
MKGSIKFRKIAFFAFCTLILTFIVSCSGDSDSGNSTPIEEQQLGEYKVTFTPLNTDLSGLPSGSGEFSINGDDFRAVLNIGQATSAGHLQFITTGTGCPDITADTNQDGIIDVVEAITITGYPLIPLDRDLSTQLSGGNFPEGANYNYDESTSYSLMLSDLKLPDEDTNDIFVKLQEMENLNLEGKAVIIHGIPDSLDLPDSVLGVANLSAQATLPILCGIITKANGSTPSEITRIE